MDAVNANQQQMGLVGTQDVGGAAPVGGAGTAPTLYMTPDALMSYVQQRLLGIDSQMQTYFKNEQASHDAQNQLGEAQAIFAKYSDGFNINDKGNSGRPHAGTEMLRDLQTQIDNTTDPAIKTKLIGARDEIAHAMGGDTFVNALNSQSESAGQVLNDMIKNYGSDTDALCNGVGCNANEITGGVNGDASAARMVTGSTISGAVDSLKQAAQEYSGNAEMGMIQLQSLMSQRQSALQLCTNLVQSLGDQADKIASNVGH